MEGFCSSKPFSSMLLLLMLLICLVLPTHVLRRRTMYGWHRFPLLLYVRQLVFPVSQVEWSGVRCLFRRLHVRISGQNASRQDGGSPNSRRSAITLGDQCSHLNSRLSSNIFCHLFTDNPPPLFFSFLPGGRCWLPNA